MVNKNNLQLVFKRKELIHHKKKGRILFKKLAKPSCFKLSPDAIIKICFLQWVLNCQYENNPNYFLDRVNKYFVSDFCHKMNHKLD